MNVSFQKTKKKIGAALAPRGKDHLSDYCPELENKILVGTHHKTGTAWMSSIFRHICEKFSLDFYAGGQEHLPNGFDVFLQSHSRFDWNELSGDIRGLHIIRDPRDRIVSGCFYHQKSDEAWLHVKKEEFGGLTYQEKINSFESVDDRVAFEMENSGMRGIQEMLDWDYHNPSFFEVKYEDLVVDENLTLFHDLFLFLGFPGKSIPEILRICYDNSLFSGALKNSVHIRSGKSRQWEKHLTPVNRQRFVQLFGEALIKLGYEENNDWVNK